MKALTLILSTLLVSLAVSNFVPIPDYNISLLEGTWNVQSIYDTTGNDWSTAYCFQITFKSLNKSAINMTMLKYNVGKFTEDSYTLYPNAENAAILYQDTDHLEPPLLILNSSSIPYWTGNGSATTIFAINYTVFNELPQYVIMGLSQWYDTQYDIRPFLSQLNLPIDYTQNFRNFYFINTACDAHFDWSPQKIFNASALLGDWNLIAVYEPFNQALVPWYTEGPIFNWEEAICGKVKFEKNLLGGSQQKMTLSLESLLYQTHFERSWQIGVTPGLNAALMGFDIVGSTLLYVGYADLAGNMILTAGTTTSFFLSTLTDTFTTPYRAIFEAYIVNFGYEFDVDYVTPIAPCAI